jgi:hypothetical protein
LAQLTKHQKFEYREIPRAQIQEAPYNPNVMDEEELAFLKRKVRDVGILETIIWNETTGRLVGGHHRLRVLDSLEANTEYSVGVSVVRLNAKREREMNIFLNNAQAQGRFNKEAFFDLLAAAPEIQLAEIGFSRDDLGMEFGDLPNITQLETASAKKKKNSAAVPAPLPPAPAIPEPAPEESAAEPEVDAPLADDGSCFLLITFDSFEDRVEFLTSRRFPMDTEHVSMAELGLGV